MTKKGNLFHLTKSLSKSEKRYFKTSLGEKTVNKNYVKLFNIINKQTEYDENEIRKFDNYGFDYAEGVDKLTDVLAELGEPRFSYISGMASIHWILFSCISIVGGVKDVLEIGTYDGKTALILSKLFSDGHVTTIDLPSDDRL